MHPWPQWIKSLKSHEILQDLIGYFSMMTSLAFTQGLQPLCLPCATTKLARLPLEAQRRPKGCLGHSRVAQRTFRPCQGRHGCHEVLSMFKAVAQRSLRRSVAHRSLKGGRRKAHTLPWSQKGCTGVDHWLPRKKKAHNCKHCVSIWAMLLLLLYHHSASFGRPIASTEQPMWQPLCLHSATTATLEPPWQWFCVHSASFALPVVPLYSILVIERRHTGCAAAVKQNQNFLGLGKQWASWSFFWSLKGGTKVAALCKGGLSN